MDGQDVTDKIRTAEVTLAAAKVSRLPEVRAKLVAVQRSFAVGRGVVMEGRDIGTVVFPDAALKVFLKADPVERARRRLKQDSKGGRSATLEQTGAEIGRRDQLDAREEDLTAGGRARRLRNRLHPPGCRPSRRADRGIGAAEETARARLNYGIRNISKGGKPSKSSRL